MRTRIRNAWSVLTGKAAVCTHDSHVTTSGNYTVYYCGQPSLYIAPTTMATPFRNLTIQ